MYPLNVTLPAPLIGFAVANDEAEHAALTESGYLPALAGADLAAGEEVSEVKRGPGRPKKAE